MRRAFVFIRLGGTGDTYTYEIEIRSARGRSRITLDSGPDGMKLRRNRLTWKVPATHAPSPQSVFHAFKVEVTAPR